MPSAPATTGTSTAERKPFTSQRFAYSMTYPADWVVVENKGEWRKGTVLDPYYPGSDVFASSTVGGNLRRVIVSAQAREQDMTLDEWVTTTKEVVRTHFVECGAPITTEAGKLGDVPAQLVTYHCLYNEQNHIILYVLAQHGNRNYLVDWNSLSGNEAADRATFEQFLETFTFTE
jgi:hypothetical protein